LNVHSPSEAQVANATVCWREYLDQSDKWLDKTHNKELHNLYFGQM
jgi:hypothetical protein